MDIVERLREHNEPPFDYIAHEAASEIEQLREDKNKSHELMVWFVEEIKRLRQGIALHDAADTIERLRNNQSILITSFRINMMRLCPDYSHEEFDKDIAAMLKEKE